MKRIVLFTIGGLMVLVLLLAALAPTIASGVAPGKIEAAAAEQIRGRVRVQDVSVGWFSPTRVGPVEIVDPEGRTAARVTLGTPVTLWRIVSERWWSAKRLDVGELEVSGVLDLVRDPATGRTNLERALEPKNPGAAPSKDGGAGKGSGGGGSGGGPDSVKGRVRLASLDATVRDALPGGGFTPEQGVKGLKGTLDLNYDRQPLALVAAADLSGAAVGPGVGPDPVSLKADANVRPKQAGGAGLAALDSAKVNVAVSNAPVGIIDALAAQGGALVKGVGPTADLKLAAGGTPTDAAARLDLRSRGVNANLDVALKDGVVTAAAPAAQGGGAGGGGGAATNRVTVESTEFLASVPALREALANAARSVELEKAPGIEITIERLRWPVPASLLGGAAAGNAGGAGGDPASADLRGAGMNVTVRVDGMSGRVALNAPAPGSKPTLAGQVQTPAAPAPPADWRPFTLAPTELSISAPDLSKPLTVTGGTRATISGSPAGELAIRATATGLTDAQGRLRALGKAGFADNVDALATLTGMSTALLQPIVSGMDMPLDLAEAVGPSVDVALTAKANTQGFGAAPAGNAAAGGAGGDLPPVDATVNVTSQNVRVQGAGRYDKGVASVTGDGLSVNVASVTPIARAFLEKPGQPGTLELSGPGALTLNVRQFSAPVDRLKGAEALGAVRAQITAEVQRLGVLPLLASAPVPGSAPGAPAAPRAAPGAQPVLVDRLTTNITLDGANPPQMALQGAMTHEGQPFTLDGQLRLDGIAGGKLPAGNQAGAAQVIAFKPAGRIDLKAMPRSVLNLVPAAQPYGTGSIVGADTAAQIAQAVRASIGRTASVAVVTQPEGDAQAASVKLTTDAGGVGGDVTARLTPAALTVSTLQLGLGMSPEIVNPVLAAAGQPAPGQAAPGQAAPGQPAAPSPRLAGPFRLSLQSADPITVPLKPGTFEPDYARASDATVRLSTDNDIAVENVPAGEDEGGRIRTTAVRVRQLQGQVKAPLSGLDPALTGQQRAGKRLSAQFAASAVGGDGRSSIADVTASATAGMNGADPDATVKIAAIDTHVAEGIIGKPGLLSGALGERADANLRVQPQAGGNTAISADLTAPRVSEARVDLLMTADRIALTRPSVITWRPDPAFLNQYLFRGDAAAAAPQPQPGRPGLGGPIRGRDQAAPAPASGPSLSVAQASPITVNLARLAIATGRTAAVNGQPQPATGPLLPGVFDLDASITAPSIAMAAPGGAPGQAPTTITLDGLRAAARYEKAPNPAQFGAVLADLTIDRVAGAGVTGDKRSAATVRIANLADARGVVTADAAVVNLDADLASFPTPIIDRLANQNGLLAEALGPTVDVKARAQNVTAGGGDRARAAGDIAFEASSPRASARLQGRIAAGVFEQTGPISVKIVEIRPELVRMLSGGLPLVDSVQKTRQDEPGGMEGEGLRIPIDGDLTKLAGQARIDPGVARFTTDPVLGQFVEALGGNAQGQIGRRMEPFLVRAAQGVLTYDRFSLPLGSFNLETKGSVDLVRRQIDVTTYVPLFSLTQKAAGDLNTGIAGKLGVLDKNTPVPITTRGPLGQARTQVDLGLFLKERGDQLLKQPEKLIENVIGDVLGGGKKGPKKP